MVIRAFFRRPSVCWGNLVGLFGFDLPGEDNREDWLRAGGGIESKLGALMLNATTQGEAPNAWLAANWRMSF